MELLFSARTLVSESGQSAMAFNLRRIVDHRFYHTAVVDGDGGLRLSLASRLVSAIASTTRRCVADDLSTSDAAFRRRVGHGRNHRRSHFEFQFFDFIPIAIQIA